MQIKREAGGANRPGSVFRFFFLFSLTTDWLFVSDGVSLFVQAEATNVFILCSPSRQLLTGALRDSISKTILVLVCSQDTNQEPTACYSVAILCNPARPHLSVVVVCEHLSKGKQARYIPGREREVYSCNVIIAALVVSVPLSLFLFFSVFDDLEILFVLYGWS